MLWKTVVSKEISEGIRQFGLPRNVMVDFCNKIHHDIPELYSRLRGHRVSGDERFYWHNIKVPDGADLHLFAVNIDDTTANGMLILNKILYRKITHG